MADLIGATTISSGKHVRASKDRIINKFPPAFQLEETPYRQTQFHALVKSACGENKTLTGLRICKGILIGDLSVGKTCLVQRFVHDIFSRDYKATIGVDFEVERFDILNTPFNLQIWDTAGQERFRSIASAYYRGAHVILIAFDLSEKMTLENTPRWLEEAKEDSKNEDAIVFLIGTKKDLCSQIEYELMEELALTKARELGAEYWCVSSKTGENVDELFHRVAAITFDSLVYKEVSFPQVQQKIGQGSNLIKISKPADLTGSLDDSYKGRTKSKCC